MIDVDIHLCLYLAVLLVSAVGALVIGVATTLVLTVVAILVSILGRHGARSHPDDESNSGQVWFWRQETLPGQLGNGAGPTQLSAGYPPLPTDDELHIPALA